MFQSLHCSDKERAVTDGNDNVVGNAAELLENLVDVGFRTFVKIGIGDVVGVVDAVLSDASAADVGAVVSAPCASIIVIFLGLVPSGT